MWTSNSLILELLVSNKIIHLGLFPVSCGYIFFCLFVCFCSAKFVTSVERNQSNMNANHLAAAKSLQSCPTPRDPCDPIDGSPPGSSVHGIFQARVLEWVAIAFSGNAGALGSMPGSERSPGEGSG